MIIFYAPLSACTGQVRIAFGTWARFLLLPNQIKRILPLKKLKIKSQAYTTQKEKENQRWTSLPKYWPAQLWLRFLFSSPFQVQHKNQIELVISEAKKQTSTCPKIQTSVTLRYLQPKVTSLAESQSRNQLNSTRSVT
jgi:hypothetical protein